VWDWKYVSRQYHFRRRVGTDALDEAERKHGAQRKYGAERAHGSKESDGHGRRVAGTCQGTEFFMAEGARPHLSSRRAPITALEVAFVAVIGLVESLAQDCGLLVRAQLLESLSFTAVAR